MTTNDNASDRSVPFGFRYFESGEHQQGYTRPLYKDNEKYHARLAAWNAATQEQRDYFALVEWRKLAPYARADMVAKDATLTTRMQAAETADIARCDARRRARKEEHERRVAERAARASRNAAPPRNIRTPARVVVPPTPAPAIVTTAQVKVPSISAETASLHQRDEEYDKLCAIARAKNDALEIDAAVERLRVYDAKIQAKLQTKTIVHRCAKCNKEATKRCSRCTVVYYCTEEHQREHWTDHRSVCQAPTIAAAAHGAAALGLIFPPDTNIRYLPAYDVTGQTIHHTSFTRPPATMRLRALNSFCGTVDLSDCSHVLNLGDLLRTRDANEGLWAKKYDAADLSMRTAKYFTANPHCFDLLLTSTHLIAPQGDPSNGRLSLPNVTMILAFWRQRYGVTNTLYWVDPVSMAKTPTAARVVDTGKITSEVGRVLHPFIAADRIVISKSQAINGVVAPSSSSSSSSNTATVSAPPLILSCAHGVMDEKTRIAWAKLGYDRRQLVDVCVTEAREEDPSIDSKIVNIANVFQQRAVYDRPTNGVYSTLIYHGDVYSGIQLAVPAILAGLGWLHETKIAAMRNGAFTITDPFENTDFDAMMSTYQAHLKERQK